MNIKKISWILILYFALIEGISLLIQKITIPFLFVETEPLRAMILGVITGFIGMFLTILIYNASPYKIKINKERINKVNLLAPSLFNAIFLALAFMIQIKIDLLEIFGLIGFALLGLISIGVAAFASIILYNEFNLKIKLKIEKKSVLIKKIPYKFAIIAGFFEFFIIPLMFVFYTRGVPAFANGFFSGLIGAIIPLFIFNLALKKKKLSLQFI